MVAKNDQRAIIGATTEVATLKKVLSEAKNRAAAERTERERSRRRGWRRCRKSSRLS